MSWSMRSAIKLAALLLFLAVRAPAVPTKPSAVSSGGGLAAGMTNIVGPGVADLLAGPPAVGDIAWEEDLDGAFLRAAAEGRPVLLYATMPGCAPCRKLEATTLADAAVRKRLQQFICAKFDITEAEDLAMKLRVSATPTLLVLSSRGEEMGRSTGYLPPAEFLSALEQVAAGKPASEAARRLHGAAELLAGGSVAEAQWPEILLALGHEAGRAQLVPRILALKPPPRREIAAQLADPRLAVRLGAIELLERMSGGDFGFDPWAPPPARGEAAPPALRRWQAWAAGTNAAETELFVALSREQAQLRLADLVSEDRDRAQRARRQLVAAGPAAAGLAAAYLREHPGLPPGLADRVREVRYASLLEARPGFDPGQQAQRLVFGNLDAQLQALRELKPQGAAALPVVEDFLVHANPLLREAAVESLLMLARRDAVPRLKQLLEKETNREVIIAVARGLGALRGRAGVDLLASLLARDDEDIAIMALHSTGKLDAHAPAEAVLAKLSDPRWRVRAAALQTVHALSLAAAADAVEKLLEDEDPFVRYSAILTMPRVREGEATSRRLIKAFLADDALKPPVAAAFAQQRKSLPSLCILALTNRPAEVILGVFDAYDKDAQRALPLAQQFASHAEDDVACTALAVLAGQSSRDAATVAALQAVLEAGKRARVLSVLEHLIVPVEDDGQTARSGGDADFDVLLSELDAQAVPAADGSAKGEGGLGGLFSAFGVGAGTAREAPAARPATPQTAAVSVGDLFDAFAATQAAAAVAADEGDAEAAPAVSAEVGSLVAAARKCVARFPGDEAVGRAVDMIVLQSGDTNAIAQAREKLGRMNDDQRAAAARFMGRSPTPDALAQLRRLLRDPSRNVGAAAAAALAGHLAKPDWCDALFGELASSNPAVRISTLEAYRFGQQVQVVAARDHVRRWAGVFAARTEAPQLQALAAVFYEECRRSDDASKVAALASSPDPYVRRCALHALAKLDAPGRQGWLEKAAADASEDVREVVPSSLAQDHVDWTHRVAREEVMGTWSHSSRTARRDLKPAETELLRKLAGDASPELRVQSSLALMGSGAKFSAVNLMNSIAQCRDPASWSEQAANMLDSVYRKLDTSHAALLPLLDEARFNDDVRDAVTRRLAGPAVAAAGPVAAFRAAATNEVPAAPAATNGAAVLPSATNALRVVFFHEHGCEMCATAREVLSALKDSFPEMKVEEHEMGEAGAFKLNTALCGKFNVPDKLRGRTPSIFADAGALVGGEITFDRLADLLARSLDAPPKAATAQEP